MEVNKLNKPQSAGGKATAIKLRSEAIKKYYINPNLCKFCNSIIKINDDEKVRTVKKRKFCNKSCAASFNNSNRIKKIKITKEKIVKVPFSDLINKTKKDLFLEYKNWQSARSRIQKHARFIFMNSNLPQACAICNYNIHFEVCHINSVSTFNANSKIIDEINSLDNLIALCPNHHWEFDNIESKKIDMLSRLGSNQRPFD